MDYDNAEKPTREVDKFRVIDCGSVQKKGKSEAANLNDFVTFEQDCLNAGNQVTRHDMLQTQDTINVIFNDTDSDTSDKSSENGTVDMAMTKTINSELQDGRPEPNVERTGDGTYTNLAYTRGAQHEMISVADVHTNDSVNSRPPEKI